MQADELLAFLVGTPSVSGGEAALADAFGARLAELGFKVRRAGNNLWFTLGSGAPRLLLNSHLDTVPPAAGWSGDPFAPCWRGERLYGLGTNDAKGSVAAMTMAALALQSRADSLGGEVVFAFTAEEETGGDGIATLLDELGPLDAALIGEPTGLAACTAQRGLLILRCVAHGEAAHVAHADGARNAIHTAARDVEVLRDLEFEPHRVLGAARAQVTQIQGGRQRNQVPDSCEFFVDIRTTPNLDHAAVHADIAGRLASEVTIHSGRYRPKATPPNAAILDAVLAAGAAGPVGSATTSDWAFLGDIPAVKIGPGDTHRSHRADEYLERAELLAGVDFYVRAIDAYFGTAVRGNAPSPQRGEGIAPRGGAGPRRAAAGCDPRRGDIRPSARGDVRPPAVASPANAGAPAPRLGRMR